MKIWTCKIGEVQEQFVPEGADLPMREAVAAAYYAITGTQPAFCFSGWGGELDEGERACVENREPSPEHYALHLKREAAPDLYEALTFLVNACDYTEGRSGRLVMLPKALEQARAALSRAQASEQSGG